MTDKRLVSPTGKEIKLRDVHANRGLMYAYRRKLKRLIAQMQASTEYWLKAAYRRQLPRIAQDENPTTALTEALAKLRRQWERDFDEKASRLASWFADSAMRHTDTSLRKSLKNAGIAVEFRMSRPMHDAYTAVIKENVGLIKSIPSEYFEEVEGMVMRSVQRGRDLSHLTDELAKRYGITRRRAVLISRDQNNKANAVITQVRQKELGIEYAIWKHSHAGKKPRPSHLRADGKRYKVSEGMLIDGEYIFPGEEINCRCTAQSVIPGYHDE